MWQQPNLKFHLFYKMLVSFYIIQIKLLLKREFRVLLYAKHLKQTLFLIFQKLSANISWFVLGQLCHVTPILCNQKVKIKNKNNNIKTLEIKAQHEQNAKYIVIVLKTFHYMEISPWKVASR